MNDIYNYLSNEGFVSFNIEPLTEVKHCYKVAAYDNLVIGYVYLKPDYLGVLQWYCSEPALGSILSGLSNYLIKYESKDADSEHP